MREMATHPSYQQILGMGWHAVPLILAELEREPARWFWALRAISGEDPNPEEHQGRVTDMARDWLS